MSYEGVSFYTKELVYECELTEEDLEGKYLDNYDCPLYRSMERAGVDLRSVGGTMFFTKDGRFHNLTARMHQLDQSIREDRHNLIGERFTVKI